MTTADLVRTPVPDPTRSALGVAAVLGSAYVVSLAWHPYPLSFALKALPALILFGLAVARLRGRERVAMALAYLGAAAGDVFLDLDRTGYLRYGLACFLLTQVGFAVTFIGRARWTPSRLPLLLLLVLGEAWLLASAWDGLGGLRTPVVVYLVALLSMVGAALMVCGSRWIGVGAVAFLVSDSLIGISQFIAPFPYSTQWIVATYLLAQLLIAWGLYAPAPPRRTPSS